MPITPTITAVAATDLLDDGRETLNTNDSNLKDAIVSLSTTVDGLATTASLTTHKSSGDHDGRYYTKTEIDAMIPNGDIISIPFAFEGTNSWGSFAGRVGTQSVGAPIPPGTIKKFVATSATGTIDSADLNVAVASASIVSVGSDLQGGVALYINGTVVAGAGLDVSAAAAYGQIIMALS